jgi:hypothetical protein
LDGSGMEDESESIHTLIPQATPGSKSSTGGQKLPTNDGASRLKCGRISAGSDTKEHRKNGGPGHDWIIAHYDRASPRPYQGIPRPCYFGVPRSEAVQSPRAQQNVEWRVPGADDGAQKLG